MFAALPQGLDQMLRNDLLDKWMQGIQDSILDLQRAYILVEEWTQVITLMSKPWSLRLCPLTRPPGSRVPSHACGQLSICNGPQNHSNKNDDCVLGR